MGYYDLDAILAEEEVRRGGRGAAAGAPQAPHVCHSC
jgi:hypothetical protein